ncbi:MAG: MBL fold metallo-hydrolase [Actinobacteria bacterium]|nr:MBL fold metallo-hydrolase [Actinomycetota bacterium]
MEQLTADIWVQRMDAGGFPTIAAVALTPTRAFVIDTLMRPQDMSPVVEFLAERAGGRRTVVVNTHHHWDHVYGNAAFPGVDLVAQRACPRLIQAHGSTANESVPLQPPEGVPLPTITFGDRLTYHDEPETVHLIHTPGHSEDSLVVFLAGARLLFAGDTLEWPLPNFTQREGKDIWIHTLRQLKQLPVDLIVPSHGPAMGRALIDANERYISTVHEAVAAAKAAGAGRNDLDLPAAAFLGEDVVLDAVYEAAHRGNLVWAWDEA